MANGPNRNADDERGIDIIGLVRRHAHLIGHARSAGVVALVVTALVALIAIGYLLWFQPIRRISVLEFRPTFDRLALGEYPNGLPFAASDVAAAPIVDLVYDVNHIGEFCSRDEFRGGFFVEQRSAQSAFLDAEYQARLSDTRMTQVDRQSLQAEYEARRAALPIHFRLVFVKPRPCDDIPQVVTAKAMTDVLLTWANESETKRGVLNHQVEVLTPAILDVGLSDESSRLLRADLIRTALWHIVANIEKVEKIPGAALARLGAGRRTFAEVRNRVIDLVRSRLEPLVASAGQAMVREATQWVAETVASAEREQQAAEGRANAYLSALREYSGLPQTPARDSGGAPSGAQASDVQTISPQIDRTFIDRIIEMSAANTEFRQELTESMVDATVESVAARDRASYYRRLFQSLREQGTASISPAQVDARLADIVAEGKALVADFNSLYDEFSRVSFRPAAAMYRADKPVTTESTGEFSKRELLVLLLVVFFLTLALAFVLFLLRDRLRVGVAASRL